MIVNRLWTGLVSLDSFMKYLVIAGIYSTAGMVVYIHLIPIVIVLVFVYR